MKAWVARDKDGTPWLYAVKPHKESDCWECHIGCATMLDPDFFPSVQWEDEEPTEAEITIKPIKK